MTLTIDQIKKSISSFGFQLNREGHWHKKYNNDYSIIVRIDENDVNKCTIDFGTKIKCDRKTTCNFSKNENLVILECVNRLLEKGYKPEYLVLEKKWKLGHKGKGHLDIQILNPSKKSFAMIECKTWGEEYVNERNKVIENGGQLFSYLVQERSTQIVILYSSKIESGNIDFIAEAIDCNMLKGENSEELHKSWSKSLINNGIFAKDSYPYDIIKKNLLKKDLKVLDSDTGKGLFHSFAEILRRYAISDKSNAFNKIFNLFVCKIYDEDIHNHNDELDFQWKVNDDFNSMVERLNELYIAGIKDYLEIKIDTKFYSLISEFSFIDILNEESYNLNFEIVKEVVELLQNFQIRYTKKQQFLGDFFEDLLNTSIKQEAGQFFTPTPLARFFIKSIPVSKIIDDKISNRNVDTLPFIIDYACGAGHFLTEAIDEIEEHILKIDDKKLVGKAQKQFLAIKNNFYWAKDFVYGIEKDYRLTKTTKIALFLNGDGDAIIINADGLDSFNKSKKYKQRLKIDNQSMLNENFDILITNPPFSISGFKKDILNVNKDFYLSSYLSPKSSEIECLFLERAYQLLVQNGYAGIILPLSILNNENKIYVESRKFLLLNFSIAGIIELRDKTFKPTNTTTVALFIQKRERKFLSDSFKKIKSYLLDTSLDGEFRTILLKYSEKLSLDETVVYNNLLFEVNSSDLEKEIEDSKYLTPNHIPDNFFDFFIYYLNYDRNIVIGYSGEKKDQENFLGYRFTKSRGKEGIELIKNDNGELRTLLYSNDTKNLSYHIKLSFLGLKNEIPDVLKNHLSHIELNAFAKFDKYFTMSNPSKFFESEKFIIESNSPFGDFINTYDCEKISLKRLIKSEKLLYTSGLIYNKSIDEIPYKTNKKILTADNLSLLKGKIDLDEKIIYLKDSISISKNLTPLKNDIVISNASGSLKHLGKCIWVDRDYDGYTIGGFLGLFRFKDKKLAKAVYYRLLSKEFRKYIAGLRGQNINNLGLDKIEEFGITVPKHLDKFWSECIKKEAKFEELQKQLREMNTKNTKIVDQ